ncbi:DUF6470 family protein [Paenibacillus thiaminolyticus]|uniref:DUF6470 family protein n=1 Tax=Paenibacillus thiaminolyticus TaxID=49283 RepID=A0AAP9DV75_PANTH|nr:DUF6470 family protein [Paenibacillus thiaminolyticus]MCY9538201.1 DUF6470 family protein [Paenibacillus thiaminolyticus]MCY9602813.1 DUF6470 family protein [Paenibacillus thiaminolyticus]MCY9610798.1 DUF6470 family protein [Paenibacillus thiaminolyticus]MCY9615069.1 DUF6470 family protein [Paenibacillus thiaminolyticus]MCY9621316.1 DUF6470 family protein [Paenibacillus thiaminolyticus]
MNISDITRQIQSYSFRYEPAELTIRQRPVEMEADWQPVWDELGLQRPSVAASERKNEAIQVAVQATQQKAQEGDQLGNIAKSKTTFGQIAFERYMQKGQKEVRLYALPSQSVAIDIRVYPPEIEVQTKGVVRE